MTYQDIKYYTTINDTDSTKVSGLVDSMLNNGWVGAPILVYGESLITGSHRLAALNVIEEMVNDMEIDDSEVLNADIAEDVTDIVNEYVERTGNDIEFDCLGKIFAGTWVENHKNEIAEW